MLNYGKYELVPYGHMKTLRDVYDQQFETFNNSYGANFYAWELLATKNESKIVTMAIPDYKTLYDAQIVDKIKALQLSRLILQTTTFPKANQQLKLNQLENDTNCVIELFSYDFLKTTTNKKLL